MANGFVVKGEVVHLLCIFLLRLVAEYHPFGSIGGTFHAVLILAGGLPNDLCSFEITSAAEVDLPRMAGLAIRGTPARLRIPVDGMDGRVLWAG